MKYLLAEIDHKVDIPAERTQLKTMLMDSRSGRSKWNNPNRVGQEELYQALEKVLLDLRAYTVSLLVYALQLSCMLLFSLTVSHSWSKLARRMFLIIMMVTATFACIHS